MVSKGRFRSCEFEIPISLLKLSELFLSPCPFGEIYFGKLLIIDFIGQGNLHTWQPNSTPTDSGQMTYESLLRCVICWRHKIINTESMTFPHLDL